VLYSTVLYCSDLPHLLFFLSFSSTSYSVLFYTFFCSVLFCSVVHLILFCPTSSTSSILPLILFCSVLFYFLSCAFPALSCPVLFCPVLYCTVLSWSVMFSSPSIFYQQLFRILFNILSLLHRNISFTFFSLCYISVIFCYWLFYYYSHKCELFIISP
jgi:hypothetical protein